MWPARLRRFIAAALSVTTTPFVWAPRMVKLALPRDFGDPDEARSLSLPLQPPLPLGHASVIRARRLPSTITFRFPTKLTPANDLPPPPPESALFTAFGVGVAATTELSVSRWSDFPFGGTGPFTAPVPCVLVGTGFVIVPQVMQLNAGGFGFASK